MQAACNSFGGFVLTDHGVDLQNIIKLGHQFFELPIAVKEKYNLQHYGAKWRGYMPIGVERSVNGTPRDYKEGLCMGDEHSPLDARIGAPTFGSNVFSDLELPEMRPEYIRHHEQMKSLGNKTMGILSKSLGLSQDHLESHVTKNDPVILPRMFRYPPKVDEDDSLSEDEH
jgi:isopenicillin N synthase-like dioxygenase